MTVTTRHRGVTPATDDQSIEPAASRPVRGLPFWANPRFGLLVVIAVLVVVFSSVRSSFLDTSLTLVPMQQDVSVFLVVGLAQLSVLSLGHMNLAVPRMAAISAFAMGWCYQHLSVPLVVGLLIGLVVGAAARCIRRLDHHDHRGQFVRRDARPRLRPRRTSSRSSTAGSATASRFPSTPPEWARCATTPSATTAPETSAGRRYR